MRSHRDVVGAEQVDSTYVHLPLTLSVSVFNSVLLGLAMIPVVPGPRILAWVALMVGLSALRFALWHVHHRREVEPTQNPCWTYLAIAGAFISGILWGSATFVFSPVDDTHQLFIALVIGGMCAGAATVHAAHFPSVLAFILPTIAPLSANFFMQGHRLHTVAGAMTCVFGISLCLASLRFRQWFRATTSARLVLARRAIEIDETNARLQVEISKHRATEARLRHAQAQVEHQLAEAGRTQLIGQLAGGIAHDFNNVLAIIQANLELMEPDAGNSEAAETLRRDALSGVSHGAELTRQLLAFARRQPLHPQVTNVNELVRATARMFERLLLERIVVQLNLAPTIGWALIDRTQLEAAFINLLSNARDAMEDGGTLTITTRDLRIGSDAEDLQPAPGPGEYVLVEVADTGMGIAEAVIDKIFDPFFTTKPSGKGSGLGLSMVFGFMKQSGGHVSVHSRPGAGTVFNLYLPRSLQCGPETVEGSAGSSEPDPTGHLETILVVDDNARLRRATVRQLVHLGYHVLEAQDAMTARAILETDNTVSLLFSDVAMPGDMDGIGLVEWTAAHRPALPSLLTSGYWDSGSREQQLAAMGCRFLRKPVSRHDLAHAVHEALDRAGAAPAQSGTPGDVA